MTTEQEYNDFIYKMDMIHQVNFDFRNGKLRIQELEMKVQGQTRTVEELRRDVLYRN